MRLSRDTILIASRLHPFQLRLKSLFPSKASFPLQSKLASATVGLLQVPNTSSFGVLCFNIGEGTVVQLSCNCPTDRVGA